MKRKFKVIKYKCPNCSSVYIKDELKKESTNIEHKIENGYEVEYSTPKYFCPKCNTRITAINGFFAEDEGK